MGEIMLFDDETRWQEKTRLRHQGWRDAISGLEHGTVADVSERFDDNEKVYALELLPEDLPGKCPGGLVRNAVSKELGSDVGKVLYWNDELFVALETLPIEGPKGPLLLLGSGERGRAALEACCRIEGVQFDEDRFAVSDCTARTPGLCLDLDPQPAPACEIAANGPPVRRPIHGDSTFVEALEHVQHHCEHNRVLVFGGDLVVPIAPDTTICPPNFWDERAAAYLREQNIHVTVGHATRFALTGSPARGYLETHPDLRASAPWRIEFGIDIGPYSRGEALGLTVQELLMHYAREHDEC